MRGILMNNRTRGSIKMAIMSARRNGNPTVNNPYRNNRPTAITKIDFNDIS
jgi:hypothetical protein